jgi:hypothetical protein
VLAGGIDFAGPEAMYYFRLKLCCSLVLRSL